MAVLDFLRIEATGIELFRLGIYLRIVVDIVHGYEGKNALVQHNICVGNLVVFISLSNEMGKQWVLSKSF